METKIHFLVQNLRHSGSRMPVKDDGEPKNLALYKRCRRFKKMVDRLDPDIILAQEARPGWLKSFEMWLSDRYDMVYKERGQLGVPGLDESTPILWKKEKYERLSDGFFWLSETPELPTDSFDAPGPRIVTWVWLRDKETQQDFYCFSNHFGFGEKVRIMSQQQINRVLDALPEGTYAFIGGDYNAYYRTEKYNEFMDGSWDSVIDLRDMALNLRDEGKAITFGGMKSGHNLAFGQGRPLPEVNDTHPQIDFLMMKPHPHVTVEHYGFDYSTYDDMDDGVEPGIISDHWGLEVKVTIGIEEDTSSCQKPHEYGEDPIYF
ncbi:MAG: hypothetical protein IJ407_05365 [Clostridia bacterium]|nr:hypothetical protein [Clostridia bacterium]